MKIFDFMYYKKKLYQSFLLLYLNVKAENDLGNFKN